MDKQNTRTPMTLERFLYEHSPQAERYLREYQERHYPPSRTTPTPPAEQVEAVADSFEDTRNKQLATMQWQDILAFAKADVEGRVLFKKFIAGTPLENDIPVWMAEYAVKYQQAAIKASGAEHVRELVEALEFYANRENYLSDAEEFKKPVEGLTGMEVCMTIIDEAGKDAGERARQALSQLPEHLKARG